MGTTEGDVVPPGAEPPPPAVDGDGEGCGLREGKGDGVGVGERLDAAGDAGVE